jgi:beta-glucosidase
VVEESFVHTTNLPIFARQLHSVTMSKNVLFSCLLALSFLDSSAQKPGGLIPFMDWTLSVDERVADVVSRLTLEEKILQMQYAAPAVPRLGIPSYNWWNECLHGVARNGVATVFPQAIGMAATWDTDLVFREATVISTEARAKHHDDERNGRRGIYQGLTFWSPNINIFRDPRWGRGQETYGEDPYLTGRMGVAFVKGLQGDDPKYLKVVATAKHFAVHSGPESTRHEFDAWCSERDLFETYLPAFEALITEGKAYSVMGAYNRLWGEPCCASELLLDRILRKSWGFNGYVVSDCGAIWDIYKGHGLQQDSIRASALGVKAGCDLTCGNEYTGLVAAVQSGWVSERLIDQAVGRLFKARILLGMFDPDSMVSYNRIPITENATTESRKLNRQVARQSIVLLKNDNHLLPIQKAVRKILVTGPYANKTSVLLGNYNGTPSHPVTLLDGIRTRSGKSIKVEYSVGVHPPEEYKQAADSAEMEAAVGLSKKSDIVVFVGGISPALEGEEMNVPIKGFSGGDRSSLDLPDAQVELLKKLKSTGVPVVLVLVNGSALSITWAQENIPAIVEAWYPGEEGGNAVADVLFGDYNPSGRLPVTFYKSVNDLPDFSDYSMKNRTYRYFTGEVLFPFGHGLSYSKFTYSNPVIEAHSADTIIMSLMVSNESARDGDEVVQVYSSKPGSKYDQPVKKLVAFKRTSVRARATVKVYIPFAVKGLRVYDPLLGDYVIEPGNYEMQVGNSSENILQRMIIPIKP